MDTRTLLDQLRQLLDRRQKLAFFVTDDTGYLSIDGELIRKVRALIDETVDLLRRLAEHFEAESLAHSRQSEAAAEEGDFLKEIGAQISSELAAREVSNLAFVSRGLLEEIRTSIANAVRAQQIWGVVSHTDAGLRRVGKALIALESAICEYEGLPAPDRRWADLRDSLESRRLYTQFRRAILRHDREHPELEDRLGAAAHRIALLRDLEIYPFLRIDDRKQIRRFQKRILGWLEGGSERSEEAGRRLWQDLVSFAHLLTQINDREVLREHDLKTTRTIYRQFFRAPSPPRRISPRHLRELEKLLGRDDELDEIILHPEGHELADLKAPLERISHRLDPVAGRVPEGFLPAPEIDPAGDH